VSNLGKEGRKEGKIINKALGSEVEEHHIKNKNNPCRPLLPSHVMRLGQIPIPDLTTFLWTDKLMDPKELEILDSTENH
jgi:hypothetical protein